MIIQQLQKQDINKTLDVVIEFINQNIGNDNYVNDWLTYEFYKMEFEKGDKSVFQTFVAKTDGKFIYEVVGFIMGSRSGTKVYDVRQHFVSSYYRRKHVARDLKNTLTDYAKQQGYWAITSDVLKSNIASVKLNECCKWNCMKLDEQTNRYYKILK